MSIQKQNGDMSIWQCRNEVLHKLVEDLLGHGSGVSCCDSNLWYIVQSLQVFWIYCIDSWCLTLSLPKSFLFLLSFGLRLVGMNEQWCRSSFDPMLLVCIESWTNKKQLEQNNKVVGCP